MVDPLARRPLYRQLADDLHRRIHAGEFPPGTALPSEPDLQAHYGLGLQTVRNAIDLLVLRGLVVKRHGARTRVRETPPMTVVRYPAGHDIKGRVASDEECREWDLPTGALMLVVVEIGTGFEIDAFPADRTALRHESEQDDRMA